MVDIEKIDTKDKRLLYQLYNNSRQSFSNIGKKIGLHKDSVAHRVKRLQEKGILLYFCTEFDYLKLDYIPLRLYFNFQYTTPEIKNEIIHHFTSNSKTTVVMETEGSYDLVVLILVQRIFEIRRFWQETLDKYGDYFSNIVYSNYWGEELYPISFMIDGIDDRNIFKERIWKKEIDIDDIDFNILKILTNNSRIPTMEISKKLNINIKTTSERIKRLIKNNVILRFSIVVNWNKIGYRFYKIDIFLKEHNKKQEIIDYIKNNPYLAYIDHTLGYADLELEMYLKNIDHLREIMVDISNKFPKVIRKYSYFDHIREHKVFKL